MNWLDITLLIILLISVIRGASLGAIRGLLQIVAAVVAFTECWRLAPWIRDTIFPLLNLSSPTLGFLVPIASFILIYVTIWFLGSALARMLERGALGFFNRIFGAVLGLIIGIYALGYLLSLVDRVLPTSEELANRGVVDPRSQSQLYMPIKASISDLEGIETYIRSL